MTYLSVTEKELEQRRQSLVEEIAARHKQKRQAMKNGKVLNPPVSPLAVEVLETGGIPAGVSFRNAL
jgi:hypothetical protein